MNILVTGAGGFIGRSLCARLVKGGHKVYGLSSRKPLDPVTGLAGYFEQDISSPFKLPHTFDYIFHLAAYNITNVGDTTSDLYDKVNVQGTQHVIEAIDAANLVYISSTKVYRNEGKPLTEDSDIDAQGKYEASKYKAEGLCASIFKGKRLVIFRSANVIGFGQAAKAVLPVFIDKAKHNQPLDISVSSQTAMQFVYVEDMVDAFISVIKNPSAQGVFNIASSERTTIEGLAKKVIAATHSKSNLNLKGGSSAVAASPIVCDKAHKELGWRAQTPLDTVLERYVNEDAVYGI